MRFLKSCFSPYQQECDNYIIRSINLEKYVQRVLKSKLSLFDIGEDIIESKRWKYNNMYTHSE